MKKIIFITNYFGNGGAATVMKSIITALQYKYIVKIVAFRDDNNKYDLPKNIQYIALNNKNSLNQVEKIKTVFKLRKLLKKEKPDIIVSFEYFVNMYTIIANAFIKNKLIISERNDPSRVGNRRKNIRNFLYIFADTLVCQTNDAKRYFPKYIQKKTVIILNPIKENLPNPYTGVRNNIIVNFCRLEKQKNLFLLIDAFEIVSKKYSNYNLHIYGDGKEKEDLICYIKNKKMDNKVSIFPFDSNIHKKIIKSCMFVSSSDYEGLSNSMLESMAIGIPTICTDCPCGGARMVIKDGENGFLVEVGNKKMLSEKMLKVIENIEVQKKLSNNATKIREKLSTDNITKQWLKIF